MFNVNSEKCRIALEYPLSCVSKEFIFKTQGDSNNVLVEVQVVRLPGVRAS